MLLLIASIATRGLGQTSKVKAIPKSYKIDLENPSLLKKDAGAIKKLGKAERKKYKTAFQEKKKSLKLTERQYDHKLDSLFKAKNLKREAASIKDKVMNNKALYAEANSRLDSEEGYVKGKQALGEAKNYRKKFKDNEKRLKRLKKDSLRLNSLSIDSSAINSKVPSEKWMAKKRRLSKEQQNNLIPVDSTTVTNSDEFRKLVTYKEQLDSFSGIDNTGLAIDSMVSKDHVNLDALALKDSLMLHSSVGDSAELLVKMLHIDSAQYMNMDSVAKSRLSEEIDGYASKELASITPAIEGHLPTEQTPELQQAFIAEEYGITPDELNAMMTNISDVKTFKIDQEKIDEAKKKYINHFAGKEQLLAQAQEKVTALQKVSKLKTFFEELTDQDSASYGELETIEKFHLGGYVQFENQRAFMIDFSPTLSYGLTGKLSVGVGYNSKFEVKQRKVSRRQIAYRFFVDYMLPGSLFVHLEYEDLKIEETESSAVVSEGGRDRYKGHYLGLGKKIKLNEKMSSNVMILYNFKYVKGGPYKSPFSFRFGVEF